MSETSSNGSSRYAVEHLSDAELLAAARGLVARSNQQLAELLAHLAEVEARGIHRVQACASLCAYCVYELRLSEDTAFRYARAAKLGRRFPVLFEQIAAGELHLTGVLLLGPHLTEENHREVLRLAKHRSKREIIQLVRRLDPLPDVPSRIEPLGTAGAGQRTTNATWSAFMQALNPVRELAPRDRPSNWLHDVADAQSARHECTPSAEPETWTQSGAVQDWPGTPDYSAQSLGIGRAEEPGLEQADARDDNGAGASEVTLRPRGAQEHERTAPYLSPQRYSIQFTATQEYVDLLERARDLLSHAVPSRSIAEVHLRGMRAFVAELERRRFGAPQSARRTAAIQPAQCADASEEVVPGRPIRSRSSGTDDRRTEASATDDRGTSAHGTGDVVPDAAESEDRSTTDCATTDCATTDCATTDCATTDCATTDCGTERSTRARSRRGDALEVPRRRGEGESRPCEKPLARYIPANVRRDVRNRDEGRCAYVAADGQRCRETSFLELHHHAPHAQGGAARVENLSLYCRAHNALAAERDFGRTYMTRRSGRE